MQSLTITDTNGTEIPYSVYGDEYVFTMPKYRPRVSAEFEQKDYTVSIELHSVRYVISYIVVYRFAGSMLEPVDRVYLLRAMFEVIMVVDTVYRIRGGRLDAVDVCAFNIDLRKIFKLISGNRISLWKRVKLLDLYVMAHIKIR